jgi:hypothetical protein
MEASRIAVSVLFMTFLLLNVSASYQFLFQFLPPVQGRSYLNRLQSLRSLHARYSRQKTDKKRLESAAFYPISTC